MVYGTTLQPPELPRQRCILLCSRHGSYPLPSEIETNIFELCVILSSFPWLSSILSKITVKFETIRGWKNTEKSLAKKKKNELQVEERSH